MFKNIPISALIGLFFTGLYFFIAIFAPWIAPYGMAEAVGDVWEPSSAKHWLGTDSIGRDLLSRMIYGGRTTIFIATAATILSFTLGSCLGLLAAVMGGWVDQAISRFVDLIMSIPTLIFALVVLSVMPVTIPVLILVMGLLDSTRVYRLSRAVAVDINVMDYVEAATLRGEGRAGSFSVKSYPTHLAHWSLKWGCVSSSQSSSSRRCRSLVSAYSPPARTGAAS